MSAPTETPTLSKTRFLAGLQCSKRLYYEAHHPDLADPLDEAEEAVLETGAEVGTLAHRFFPGGVLVPVDPEHTAQALETTRALLQTPTVPALFEAAFAYENTLVRVDVLVRNPDNTFDLLEVKASSGVKDEHLSDAAFQRHVLECAGVPVRAVRVLHPNTEYVRQPGALDVAQFFRDVDVTTEAEQLAPEVMTRIPSMLRVLQMPAPPAVEPGLHCKKPQRCPFYGTCHITHSPTAVDRLPRMHPSTRAKLASLGIHDIHDVPDDWSTVPNLPKGFKGLSENQMRVVRVVKTGIPFFDAPKIREALATLRPPLHFLDFETIQPVVPLWPGMRAYDYLPVQWSDFQLDAQGRATRDDFLHQDATDPRRAFLQSLMTRLRTAGNIVVYSSFEEKRLRELQQAFPEYGSAIDDILGKCFDLLALLRDTVYYREFDYSHSLKHVLPVLVPGFGYSDLAIQNGAQAAAAYMEMMDPTTTPARRAELSMQLITYCGRDTEAMLRIFLTLQERVGLTPHVATPSVERQVARTRPRVRRG